jgi:hypothetical protein
VTAKPSPALLRGFRRRKESERLAFRTRALGWWRIPPSPAQRANLGLLVAWLNPKSREFCANVRGAAGGGVGFGAGDFVAAQIGLGFPNLTGAAIMLALLRGIQSVGTPTVGGAIGGGKQRKPQAIGKGVVQLFKAPALAPRPALPHHNIFARLSPNDAKLAKDMFNITKMGRRFHWPGTALPCGQIWVVDHVSPRSGCRPLSL